MSNSALDILLNKYPLDKIEIIKCPSAETLAISPGYTGVVVSNCSMIAGPWISCPGIREALLKHLAIFGLSGFSKNTGLSPSALGGGGVLLAKFCDENSNNLAIAVSLILAAVLNQEQL